jgi:acyl-CoA thioesterase-1
MNCRLEILRAEAQRSRNQMERKVNANVFFILAITVGAFLTCSCSKSRREPVQEPERAAQSVPTIQQEDDRPLIVAFGDSLTAGSGVDPDQNYPSKLQAKIDQAGYRYRVLNAGVSGETSSQGLNRVETYLNPPPVIAIVELGANDGLRGLPIANIRSNLAAIAERFRSAGAKVIVAGMEVPPNYGPQYADSFREVFQSVAREYDAYLIPFFLDGVGGHPELNQDDGIHPTPEGYDIVVENVWRVLEPLL